MAIIEDISLIQNCNRMCQCMICGCVWWNYCGVCCGGCHEANLFYSWWLCKPQDLMMLDPLCCHICACDGLGYNCLYYGIICCAPKAVVEWSGLRAAGKTAADLNSGKTIIINNSTPNVVYMDPSYSVQTTTRNYGNTNVGMNMNVGGGMGMGANVNMGGMELSTNVNMGGMGMNTNMNVGGGMGMNTNMNVGVGGGMGMNTNMNVGMNGPNMNVNSNFGGANMNMNMNTPGINAKVSF